MCVYEKWWYPLAPKFGDICTVSELFYSPDTPDGIGAYRFEEFPLPEPYRYGAWRRGLKPGSLEPNFIPTEEAENVEICYGEIEIALA